MGTFNAHHGAPRARAARISSAAIAIGTLDVDVWAFQELDRRVRRSWWRDQPATLGSAANHVERMFEATVRIGAAGEYGIGLSTRYPMRGERSHRLPHSHGREPRSAISALLDTPTVGTVRVVCTHLQNASRRDHANIEARTQLDALLEDLAKLRDEACPTVIAGDLNLDPEIVDPLCRAHGYTPSAPTATFPSWAPTRALDRIIVRGLDVVDVVAVPVTVSDHRPLVATIEKTSGRGRVGEMMR